MFYAIKNEFIQATINSLGAELTELIDSEGINRLHTKNVETWKSVSPVLFPQVSRIKGGCYFVDGKEYQMPTHGFARNKEFDIVSKTDESITLSIKSDDETLKIYPYLFTFYIKFEVIKNKLIVNFKIVNDGENIMYFMLGGHPGFKVPLFDDECFEDYFIKFELKEKARAMKVVDSFIANEYVDNYLNNEDTINLKRHLFDPDAIILKDLKSSYADLCSKKNNKFIRFYFKDFDILAFWTMINDKANFLCFEPWHGIQKDFVLDHKKMGIIELSPHQFKTYNYAIEVN